MSYGIFKSKVLDFVLQRRDRLTPRDIQKGLSDFIGRREVNTALKELIAEERLSYTYEFGHTFVEPSLNTTIQLTDRIVLIPPGRSFEPGSDKVFITLRPGISFGNGQHPTSVLVLQGMERVFSGKMTDFIPEDILDIGTGSGILALASIKLGGKMAFGIDNDPNAVFEANENVALNSLENQVRISKTSLESVQGKFELILANLRAPTLKDISWGLTKYSRDRSVFIMSGFYPEETQGLLERYKKTGWSCHYRARQGNWEMVILLSMSNKQV